MEYKLVSLPQDDGITKIGSNVFLVHSMNQESYPLVPSMLRTLEDVYFDYRYLPNFPANFCERTSLELEKRNDQFTIVPRYFNVDECPPKWARERYPYFRAHNVSIDIAERLYDLTLSQFNEYLYEPYPEGIIIIEPGTKLYQRYVVPAVLLQSGLQSERLG